MEKAAQADLVAGAVVEYKNVDDALAALDMIKAADDAED